MGNYMDDFYTAMREAGIDKAIIGSEVYLYYMHKELTTTTRRMRISYYLPVFITHISFKDAL